MAAHFSLLEKNKKLNHACRVNKKRVAGKASFVEFYGMVIGQPRSAQVMVGKG